MIVRGIDIRDTGTVLNVSVTKILKVLESSEHKIQPIKTRYDSLETDEFCTYVGEKKNKV
jgi:hypothetical protein